MVFIVLGHGHVVRVHPHDSHGPVLLSVRHRILGHSSLIQPQVGLGLMVVLVVQHVQGTGGWEEEYTGRGHAAYMIHPLQGTGG